MAIEIISMGNVAPPQVTRLSEDTNDYTFVDSLLAVVNLNLVLIDVIDFGNHVGMVKAFIESDVHNWVGTAPYLFTSTVFPFNRLLSNVREVGTVFGGGKFTQTVNTFNGSAIMSPGTPGLRFDVGNNIQPNNNFCDWSGQFIFTYN
jgi:hypothetical protein